MADSHNIFSGEAPSAPPSPTEVKVRTLRSDLEAMAKSGGGMPRFMNVRVAAPAQKDDGTGKSRTIIIVIAVAVVAALALIGYFIYAAFFAGSAASLPQAPAAGSGAASGGAGQAQGGGTPTGPAAAPLQNVSQPAAAAFTHKSLFTKPADQVLTLTLGTGGAAASATDLATFNQKLASLLSSQAGKNAAFIEVNVKDGSGNGIPVNNILAAEGATVLDPQFLAVHFSPDATFFVYRDKNGFWPGYVLALNPTENWLFLQGDVKALEASPNIANFFLNNAGTAASGGFTDGTVSSTAVRMLQFPNADVPSAFVYGWPQAKLVLSTSKDGFAVVVAHL